MSARPLLAACLVVLALAIPCCGQGFYGPGNMRGRQPQGNMGVAVHQEGTVEAVVQGGIKMINKSNQPVVVMFTPTTEVHLTGTATADYIHQGVYVEFTAAVAKDHTVKEKISELTICSPSKEHGSGLFPEGSAGAIKAGAAADNFGAAAAGAGGFDAPAGPAAGGRKSAGAARKAGAGAGVQLPATVVVRGQVKSCHGGNLIVNIGKGVVKAEVSSDAQIAVDIADCSAASKGDTISVKGRGMPPRANANFVQADSVKIVAAQPLSGGGTKKKKAAAKQPSHATKKNAAPEEPATTKPAADKPDEPAKASKPGLPGL